MKKGKNLEFQNSNNPKSKNPKIPKSRHDISVSIQVSVYKSFPLKVSSKSLELGFWFVRILVCLSEI